MIESAKIVRIIKSDKSKDGKEFITKTGKKFWKIAIQTDRYPGVWHTAFAYTLDDKVMQLKEGEEIKAVFWQEGDWKNFKLPTKIDELEERIKMLEDKVFGQSSIPTIEITNDDLPF